MKRAVLVGAGTVAGVATLRGSLVIILVMLVILVLAGRRALAAR